jgi:hypothetical protein
MEGLTSKQLNPPNPTGKGGFQDHPELISRDGRPKNAQSFSYWMNFFKTLSKEDFDNYEKNKSDKDTTMAESLAYERVKRSRPNLKEFQEVANRTEGMPKISVETSGEMKVNFSKDLSDDEKKLLEKIIEKRVEEI